jgi:putative ABC transport system ATP-binding protein
VSKSYDGEHFVLRDVDLAVREEDFILISGKNGSGKTTLLNVMGLLDFPTEGVVSIDGREVQDLPDRDVSRMRLLSIGFIFQDHNLIEEITLRQNVLLPLKLAKAERVEARAEELLSAFGLGDLGGRRAMEVSMGQRQLAAIARALANEPRAILADEPTASLDEENSAVIEEALRRVNAEMGTAVVVTHHEGLSGDGFKRRMVLRGGRLVELAESGG